MSTAEHALARVIRLAQVTRITRPKVIRRQRDVAARPLAHLVVAGDLGAAQFGDDLGQPVARRRQVVTSSPGRTLGASETEVRSAKRSTIAAPNWRLPANRTRGHRPAGAQPGRHGDTLDQPQDGGAGAAVYPADDQDQVGTGGEDQVDLLFLAPPVGEPDLLDHIQVGGGGQAPAGFQRHARGQPDEDGA